MVHLLASLSFRLACSSFFSSEFAQLKLMQSVASLRMLRVYVSQVQFSRSWSQDFGTHDRRSQVRRFQFQGPGSQVPVKVSGPRVQDLRSQGLGSQGPRVLGSRVSGPRVSGLRVTGLRVPGLGSQILILDSAMKWVGIFWVGIFRVGIFPGGIFLEPALS